MFLVILLSFSVGIVSTILVYLFLFKKQLSESMGDWVPPEPRKDRSVYSPNKDESKRLMGEVEESFE